MNKMILLLNVTAIIAIAVSGIISGDIGRFSLLFVLIIASFSISVACLLTSKPKRRHTTIRKMRNVTIRKAA